MTSSPNWSSHSGSQCIKRAGEPGDNIFPAYAKRSGSALPLGNGLYLNGDFNAVQQYILDGKPIEGVIRFFAGYAGWIMDNLPKK